MNTDKIRHALDDLLSEIHRYIGSDQDTDIKNWLMAATLQIWAGNKLCTEEYVTVLPVFHNQHYTIAQVLTAMNCVGDGPRRLDVPAFFKEIVERDIRYLTNSSREIEDLICRFLAEMALVNGDFTMEEATALRKISNMLLGVCDTADVVRGKNPEYLPHMITPKNTTGYFQSSTEKKPAKEAQEPVKEEKKEPVSSVRTPPYSEDDTPTIKVRLTLSSDDSDRKNDTAGVTVTKPIDKEKTDDTLESVLAELNSLVGLDQVKEDVQSLLNFIKICQLRIQRGMKIPTISYHLVFTGNPGTGKTTVARMVGKLYYLLGILPQGQLVETDRSGLVAGYLGQTAIKTQKVIQEALGGVLFIDEAYALANDEHDSYGKEAIETILKAMEDHRDELVVIVAGYEELMHKFIDSNPGLRSRFNKYFHFPDYTGDELLRILQRFCDSNGYTLNPDTLFLLKRKLDWIYDHREKHFGNARTIRNLFEHAINNQANRLVQDDDITDQELAELTIEDIREALEEL